MTRCVDTSVIISLLTEEDTSDAAIAWLRERLPDELAATAWLWPELQAGMARKVRTQRLSQPASGPVMRCTLRWQAETACHS